MNNNNNQHIEINSEIRFGKPVIKGTRIAVSDILEMLSNNMTVADIIEDFPQLDSEKINACFFSKLSPQPFSKQ